MFPYSYLAVCRVVPAFHCRQKLCKTKCWGKIFFGVVFFCDLSVQNTPKLTPVSLYAIFITPAVPVAEWYSVQNYRENALGRFGKFPIIFVRIVYGLRWGLRTFPCTDRPLCRPEWHGGHGRVLCPGELASTATSGTSAFRFLQVVWFWEASTYS